MPKMKSSKTLTKRVRFTGQGRVKVHHSGMGHFAFRKSRKQRKHLAKAYTLNPADEKRIEGMVFKK